MLIQGINGKNKLCTFMLPLSELQSSALEIPQARSSLLQAASIPQPAEIWRQELAACLDSQSHLWCAWC